MNTVLFSACALFCLLPGAIARADVYADFNTSLQAVGTLFHDRYALTEYKNSLFGWDIDTEIQALLAEAQANPALTKRDAQELLAKFFLSTRDFHAQVILSGQKTYTVPVGMHSASGRVFITYVKDSTAGAIALGDEVMTYDGVPAIRALRDLMIQPRNMPGADLRDAEGRMTTRYGMLVDPLPGATLLLTLKNASGVVYSQTLIWNDGSVAPKRALVGGSSAVTDAVAKTSVPAKRTRVQDLLRGEMAVNPFDYQSRKSYLPKPETVTWEAADTDYFYSWTGVLPNGKKIGMIRIPSFSLSSDAEFGTAIEEFKKLVIRMNAETDALILDTQGNRGGLVDYAHAFASFFIDAPVKTNTYAYRLFPELVNGAKQDLVELAGIHTQADVEAYFGGTQYGGYPVDLDFIHDLGVFEQGIVDDAAAGLTIGHARFYNIEKIKPYPGVQPYLKPLFVTIDAWSASCGDTFAGMMQDYGRATIVGTQSAGAGAFVGSWVKVPAASVLNVNSIHVPIALEYRLDGSKIENVGVTPDIQIAPDVYDLKTGSFKHYQKALYRQLQDYL